MNAYEVSGVVIAAVLTLAGIVASSQAVASRRDHRRFPPPGELIDVGGHRLHLIVAGAQPAAPTVVLEAGMASMSANWAWVQHELAEHGRVVSYERPAGIGPPYVLAGHSYGGLVVRMFTDRYPDEVVGIVLVDSSHPDQWVNIPASRNGRTVAMGNRVTALLARFGLLRLFRAERPFITGLPAREYAQMRAYLARPQGWSAGVDGLLAWGQQSRDPVNATRHMGGLPLVVLSVTEQDRYAEVLTRLQAELASLSSNSQHRTVAGATHYTLVSKKRYAALVSDAVRAVSVAARSGGAVR